MATLGRAFIEIVADTAKFGASIRRDLRRSLSSLDKEVKAAGDKAGRSFSSSFSSSVTKGVSTTGARVSDRVAAGMRKNERKVTESASQIANRLGIKFEEGGELAGLRFVDRAAREAKRLGLVLQVAGKDAQGRFIHAFDPATGLRTVFRDTAKIAARGGRAVADSFGRELRRGIADLGRIGLDVGKGFVKASQLIQKGLSKVTNELNRIARGAASIGTIAAAALSALPHVLSLAGSLADLSGILAALPAFATAAGIGITGLVLSLKGFSDALKATSDKQLEKALEGMGAKARALALQLRGLKTQFNTVRKAAQESFVGALGPITSVTKLLPSLRKGFAGIGTELGKIGKQLLKFATSGENLKVLSAAFTSTRKSMAGAGSGLIPLLAGLRDLVTVGLPFVVKFGDAIGGLATKFGNFLSESAKSGKATDWIQTGLDVLTQLGDIATNVFGVFKSFFTASEATGGNFLTTLQKVTGALDAFFKSAQGQAALTNFFGTLATLGDAIGPVIAAIAAQIGNLAPVISDLIITLAPAVKAVIDALGPVITALEPGLQALGGAVADTLLALVPALQPLATAISSIVVALAPALPALGGLVAALVELLAVNLGPLAQIIGVVVKALTPFIDLISGLVVQLAGQLGPVIAQIANSFVTAFLPVILELGKAFLPILPQVAGLVRSFVDGLAPALPAIAAAFLRLAAALLPLVDEFGGALMDTLVDIIPMMPELADAVVQLALTFADLVDMVIPLLPVLLPIVTSALPLLELGLLAVTAGLRIVNIMIQSVMNTFKGMMTVATTLRTVVVKAFLGIQNFVSSAIDVVLKRVQGFVDFVKGIPGRIGDLGAAIGRAISDGIGAGINLAIDAINALIRAFNRLPGPDIPEVPHLAQGGLFNSATKVMVGEAGPEVVIPLTKPLRAVQLAQASGLTDILHRAAGDTSQQRPTQVTINAPITVVTAVTDPRLVAQQITSRLARMAVA